MGGTLEKLRNFGKDLNSNDVTGATNPSDASPWGQLSGEEKGARITSGILGGLGKGLQTRQAQMPRSGGGAPLQLGETPAIAPVYGGIQGGYPNNPMMSQNPMGSPWDWWRGTR